MTRSVVLLLCCFSSLLWASPTGVNVEMVLPSDWNVNTLAALTGPPASPAVQNGRVYRNGSSYYTNVPAEYAELEVVQPDNGVRSQTGPAKVIINGLAAVEVYIICTAAAFASFTTGPNFGFTLVVGADSLPVTVTANLTDINGPAALNFYMYKRTYDNAQEINLPGCNCINSYMYQIGVRAKPDDSGDTVLGVSYVIAGAVVIGGGSFIVLSIVFCCWYRRWRRGRKTQVETLRRLAASTEHTVIPAKDIKLAENLGEGFSGIVYKSRWHGTEVAAKRMRNQQDTPENRKSFEMETFVHEKLLGHPRVVTYLGACYDPPDLTIVMELYPCGSIEDVLIRDRKFPVHNKLSHKELKINLETIVRMAVDASSGLLHCHYSLLVHRDVRAANFLVTLEHGLYRATISDFGLSRFLDKDHTEGFGDDGERLPMLWMSPEATLFNKFSAASDVFMFGHFLCELFARVRPYTGIGMATIMRMKQMQQLDVRPMIPENCPWKLRKIISECWHYEPRARPKMQDINDQLVDLQKEVETCAAHDVAKTFDIGAEPVFPTDTTEFKEASDNREEGNYSTYHKVGYVEVEGKSSSTKQKENIYDTPYMEMTTTKATRATATSSAHAISNIMNAGLGNAREELVKQQSTPLPPASSSSSDGGSTSKDDEPAETTTAGVSHENISPVAALIAGFAEKNSGDHSPSTDKGTIRLTATKETLRQSGAGVV